MNPHEALYDEELKRYYTLSIPAFCVKSGIGQTTVREMIADGRLEAVRLGKKKIMVVVRSYFAWLDKEAAQGLPEYAGVKAAHEARKKQIEDGLRRPGSGPRAEARQEKLAEGERALKELQDAGVEI